MFIGKLKSSIKLKNDAAGYWVGIKLDEPYGHCNGK